MKKRILIISSVFITTVMYSCKEEFMEITPQGVYDLASLTNKKGVDGMLINAYATLDGRQDQQNGGASNWLWGSIRGGDAYKGTEPDDMNEANPVMRFVELSPNNGQLNNKWTGIWDGVGSANEVLRVLPKATDISAAEAKQIEGEAKFIRAFMHFEAKKGFNNVPYIDETVNNFKVPNTDASGNYVNIWPQIEADFKWAYDNLEEVRPQVGRANKWSAASFLAKVYMFQNKFAEAKALFDLVIANGKTSNGLKYALAPNYHANFRATTEHNSETIFTVEASYGDGSNTNGNYDNTLNYPHGGSATTEKPGACCGFFQPSQNLVNSFKTTAGLPQLDTYDNTDVTSDELLESTQAFTPYAGTLDPRLDWTVGRRGIPYFDWGIHPGRNWIRKVTYGGPYSPKKNTYYKADIGTLGGTVGWGFANNALNFTAMRYADVLLMAAEAEIEVGSLEKAREYINMVRERAAASPVMNGAAQAANYSVSTYPASAFSGKEAARKIVRFERKIELGMEGHRFFDLVRWGIADVVINTEYFSKERVRRADALGGAAFTKGKHEYLPIPEFAVTSSIADGKPTLKQNPGY